MQGPSSIGPRHSSHLAVEAVERLRTGAAITWTLRRTITWTLRRTLRRCKGPGAQRRGAHQPQAQFAYGVVVEWVEWAVARQ
jgi:hypothetical protein